MDFVHFSLPFTNPVLVFGIILFIILVSPLVLKKFRIPGIVGLIISGMIIGPKGFNLLANDSGIQLFGTVGLLYIMFIAGLEIDLLQFKLNRHKGIAYGLLLFVIPLICGLILTFGVLNLSPIPALLISIMLSTNTLVSYPIAIRMGLTRNAAVTTAVGGTIITDTLVLLALGFIEHFSTGTLDLIYFIKLIVFLAVYLYIIFIVLPKITSYYFKNIETDTINQYIFVLSLAFLGSFLSQLIGLEPIIGAFLTGLSLNRQIPNTSVLMGRIEFIGNSIFIPFFLITVGMLVDIRIIINQFDSVGIGISFFISSLIGIFIATYIAKLIFKFSNEQRFLILGLNSSHAAATIAITLVGYKLGLLNETYINATVILILVSCLFSSFVVERFGKKVASSNTTIPTNSSIKTQRILVPFSNPKTVELLLEMSLAIKEPNNESIYPLFVVSDEEKAEEQIHTMFNSLTNAKRQAESVKVKMQIISRVDTSVTDGIARAIKEILSNCVIIGWNFKSNAFGSINNKQLEQLLNITNTTILVSKITHPINVTQTIRVFVPENGELEIGCPTWVQLLTQLSSNIGADVHFYGFEQTLNRLNLYIKSSKSPLKFKTTSINAYYELLSISESISDTDLLIIVNSRPKGISYNSTYSIAFNRAIRQFTDQNVIVLFPEQSSVYSPDLMYSNSDVLDASLIDENISIYYRIKNYFERIFTVK